MPDDKPIPVVRSGVYQATGRRRFWQRRWVVIKPGHGVKRFFTETGAMRWERRHP